MRKKILVLLVLAGFVILGIAAGSPEKAIHDNLKVLPKNISQADLDSLMEDYSSMIGVDCGFCHVKTKTDPEKYDYASDAKPEKEITRKMMKMTEKINEDFFEYKITYKHDEVLAVSCKTCHHGSPRPELVEVKKD